METLFRVKRKLEAWYGDHGANSGDLKVIIADYSPATTREENGKVYHYPETIEVKFENQSNSWYSFRLSDQKFIREGADLVGSKGLTAAQVYKCQALEAKARIARLTLGRPQ